jgi:hypothetical protein
VLALCECQLCIYYSIAFQINGTQYRCKLCPNQRWICLSKALEHENTVRHQHRYRQLDTPPGGSEYDLDYGGLGPSCPSGTTFNAQPSSPTSVHSADPVYPISTYISVPGPALEDDAADQIYDDWGGEWFRTAPQPANDDLIGFDTLDDAHETQCDLQKQPQQSKFSHPDIEEQADGSDIGDPISDDDHSLQQADEEGE